jgi:hypothetical protein
MALYVSHTTLHKIDFKVFTTHIPPRRDHNLVKKLLSKHKIHIEFSSCFLCCIFLAVHFPLRYLHLPAFYLAISLTLPEQRAVTQEQQTFQTHPFPSYFLLHFLDLRQSSRCLTSSFMQKFKPLDRLKLSRIAENMVLLYLLLLPTQFAYSHFHCRGLIFTNLLYNAELSRTLRSYAILIIVSETYIHTYIHTYIFHTFVP